MEKLIIKSKKLLVKTFGIKIMFFLNVLRVSKASLFTLHAEV